MYDTRLEQIHAKRGSLSPQFQLVVALRKDERFRGGVYDAYDSPTGRLVIRLTLDAIKVIDGRQFGEPGTCGSVNGKWFDTVAEDGICVSVASQYRIHRLAAQVT